MSSYTAVPDSTDPDLSFMRTPYNLLTKKTGGELYGSFDDKDAFKAQQSSTSCRPILETIAKNSRRKCIKSRRKKHINWR